MQSSRAAEVEAVTGPAGTSPFTQPKVDTMMASAISSPPTGPIPRTRSVAGENLDSGLSGEPSAVGLQRRR